MQRFAAVPAVAGFPQPGLKPPFVGYIKKGPDPPIALSPTSIRLIGPNREQISLDVSPKPSDQCDDRNPVKENSISENAIDSENISKLAPDTAKPKGARKAGKKAKSAKKVARAKKTPGKPNADRTNKKAEVIAMMKRAKGATLPEINESDRLAAGSRTPYAASLASWAARAGRRSTRPRTPQANGRTRSGNSVRQLVVQTPFRPRQATPRVHSTVR